VKTSDSRSRSGLGIIPLRHEDFQSDPSGNYADVSQVIGLLGKNVKGRRPAPALGHYVDKAETIGNIMPSMVFLKATRPAPGHSVCWPAIVGDGLIAPAGAPGSRLQPSGGATRGMGGNVNESAAQLSFSPTPRAGSTVALPAGATSTGEPYTMRPVINETMDSDARFQAAPFATPRADDGYKLWPRLPEGMYGIAIPATNEERQVNLLLPCDPRLIAVNQIDDPAFGSLVCDMDGDGVIDHLRMARLQSAFRVVVRPVSPFVEFPDSNALAFQLSGTGNADTVGGLFYDCWRGNAMGAASVLAGGPFDTGIAGDKHQLGEDDDGHAINSMHVSLSALFKDRDNPDIDGPLHHEGYAKGGDEAPHRIRCHIVYDPNLPYSWLPGTGKVKGPGFGGGTLTGKHVVEGSSFIYVPNTPTGGPPTGGPPPPPPGTPNTPTGGPGGGGNPPPVPDGGGGNPPTPPPPNDPDDPTSGGSPKYPEGPGGDLGNDMGGPTGQGWPPKPGGPKPPPGNPPNPGGGGGGGGAEGGGHVPVGPLPPGSDMPKWKNPNGSDPFWPFGFGGGKHNKHWADQQAARAARRAARKAKHSKGKVVGVKFVPPKPPTPKPKTPERPKPKSKIIWGKDVPNVFHGHGGDGSGGGGLFRPVSPDPPVVFTPNVGPVGGGPTPASGPSSALGPPLPGRGPAPTGSFPIPVLPSGMTNELMMPSILARPQHYSRFACDLRYATSPDPYSVAVHDKTAPVTGHLVAYGAQGGSVGGSPGSTQPNYWKKTQQSRTGKFWAGTGPGGFALLSPEIDLSDLNLGTGLAPAGVTKSEVHIVATPGTYLSVGLPNMANGGIYSGWRWGAATSGLLTFEKIDSTGVLSTTLALDSGRWTPTVANVANVSAVSASQGQYSRVGNVVTCSVIVAIDPIAGATPTIISITLPVASNFGAVGDCAGKAASPDVASMSGGIYADAASDTARLQFVSTDLNQRNWCLDFSYAVI